jgi:5-methylcytosine-specific restriction enzyme A
MSVFDELKPKHSARVIDLVAAAGHDVSAWKDYRGGVENEAKNPKYCYEWAFVQENRAVVLNLWHDQLELVEGNIVQRLNPLQIVAKLSENRAHGTRVKRARAMDRAIAHAFEKHLPVRVILCDRNPNTPARVSRVQRRMLDPILWEVTSYQSHEGDCVITRNAAPAVFVDQFTTIDTENNGPTRRQTTSAMFERDAEVRQRVRDRAQGVCEYCGRIGFTTVSGAIYIETHHIVPLADKGPDNDRNVIALCPNDHRRAHHGREADQLRREFERIVATKLRPPS